MLRCSQDVIYRCLDFMVAVGSGEAGLFYAVDDDFQASLFTLRAVDSQVQERYRQHFYAIDPLQARHYVKSDRNLVSIDRVPGHLRRQSQIFLNEFLIPSGYNQILEIFVRYRSRIVAGISLLRHEEERPFTDRELSVIGQAREFVEYRLLHQHPGIFLRAEEVEPLTAREEQILTLLLQGRANTDIAARLAIAPSTVKTHLQNIYGKVGVQNRKELLVKLLDQSGMALPRA